MAYENINLWFARDKNNNIITIDKINKDNKHDNYTCPICGSSIIARTGQVMTHHFAHSDKSKCDSETQIHFWIKNELIKQGDKFKIRLDKDTIKEFVCKEVLIEQQYKTEFGTYKPDITIITESDETIYFEVAKTNKKKLEEYLDQWLELGNIVVEVETKDLINGNEIKEFKALFFDGKCFNVPRIQKKVDSFIEKVKTTNEEEKLSKLSWLWYECRKFKITNDIENIYCTIESIEDNSLIENIFKYLSKNKCNDIVNGYLNYKKGLIENLNNKYIYCDHFCNEHRVVFNTDFVFYEIFNKYNSSPLKITKFSVIDNFDKNISKLITNEEYLKEIKNKTRHTYIFPRIIVFEDNFDEFAIEIYNDEIKMRYYNEFHINEKVENIIEYMEEVNNDVSTKKQLKKNFIEIAKNILDDFSTSITMNIKKYCESNKISYSFYNKILQTTKRLTIKNENDIDEELKEFNTKYNHYLKNNYNKMHKNKIISSYRNNVLRDGWYNIGEYIDNNKNYNINYHSCYDNCSKDNKYRTITINKKHKFIIPYNIIAKSSKDISEFKKYLNSILANIQRIKPNENDMYCKGIINKINKFYEETPKCNISIISNDCNRYISMKIKKYDRMVKIYKLKDYYDNVLIIDTKELIKKSEFEKEIKKIIQKDIRAYLYK